jgi:lipopolysaccharide transport system ATP-binding protein
MSDTVIKIENLSKQYRLGNVSTGTLSHDVNRLWAKIRGKEDPYLKIGETNDRSSKGTSELVWALQDINLEIKRGDRVGIIGKNGAGKSTLLKILSKVTGPTTGQIKVKGRIGALLEVGTGFHPELTGRENIYMNGTILGMTRHNVRSKLDEIVDFAGCERYIDTPVKRYSSGMMVRLGFAVAAHLEPDILVVDEVLAVGDAEFQKKAIGKMKDVSEGHGRTILFVSHNMASVKRLCKNGIVLTDGKLDFLGAINETVSKYLQIAKSNLNTYMSPKNNEIPFNLETVKVYNIQNKKLEEFLFSQSINIFIKYTTNEIFKKSYIALHIYNSDLNFVLFSRDIESNEKLLYFREKGLHGSEICIPQYTLAPGVYSISLHFCIEKTLIRKYDNICSFRVIDESSVRCLRNLPWHGSSGIMLNWNYNS